ncbi:MAG: ATP-binding cassette domain-containing protein, partial [Planctomycetales bacterium]|nr:ATP-binding cassette domain-containing protein [Planctomycetales bacterium]
MTIVLDDRKLFTDGHHHAQNRVKIAVKDVNLWYGHGEKHALKDVNLDIYEREVTAFIGPSGCGKTTLLKCLNRMNDEIPGVVLEGSITVDGKNIYDRHFEACEYRRRFGWVAQVPNPFAKSIHANVAYGARIHGVVNGRRQMDGLVEDCLRRANLWEEVKDRLDESALSL